jgi:type II secretory pathway pseudopilin PulG
VRVEDELERVKAMASDERGHSGVKRLLGWLRRCLQDRRGLINTTDLLVASGATIILAAGIAAASLQGLDQAKLGKAQPDAQAIAAAMQTFFKDTGKWPGQAEVAGSNAPATPTIKSPIFLTTDLTQATATSAGAVLPSFGSSTTFATGQAICQANSGEGIVNATISAAAQPADSSNPGSLFRNINDYLVRKPDATKYPNWRGPYLQAEITSDPFGRVWMINAMPLFCAEDVGTGEATAGALGFAWILSAGSNRTLTTLLKTARLDDTGDDAGTILGKLVKKSTSAGF